MAFYINANTDSITYYLKTKALDRSTLNIGDVKWSVVNRDSHGWLICDGRSLQLSSYMDLFEVIGTQFGSVDAESFNLPDCRSRVIGAIGQGNGLSNRTIGQSIGEETHVLTIQEIPAHDHGGVTSDTSLNITPTNVITSVSSNSFRSTTSAGLSWDVVSSVSSSSQNISINPNPHDHSINSQGNNQPHNNMQPTLFIGNVLIYSGYSYRP